MTDMRYFGFSAPAGASLTEAFSALGDEVFRLNSEGIRLVKVYAGVDLAKATSESGGFVSLRSLQDRLNTVFLERLGLERAPALTLTAQRPLGDSEGSVLCAELWGKVERTKVRSTLVNGLTHILVETPDYTELWSSGFHADYGDGTAHEAATRCFEALSETLQSQNFTFDDIFRQWNYIGHIIDFRPDAEGKPQQNYQVFNEVRAGFYAAKLDKTQYPAATGIGMDYEGVCIDFVAVYTKHRSALRSPVQTDAFSYNQEVLVGEASHKKAPLFERGMRHTNTAMISGTASIRGQETIDKGDADKQLENTVGFIEELVHHNIKEKTAYRRVRLYVKPGVSLSKNVLDNLNIHYPAPCLINIVEADICRPDLLIEVEADIKAEADIKVEADIKAEAAPEPGPDPDLKVI